MAALVIDNGSSSYLPLVLVDARTCSSSGFLAIAIASLYIDSAYHIKSDHTQLGQSKGRE